MDYTVKIDTNKCVGCGLCANDCPTQHFCIENGKALSQTGLCIGCGHCFAICPNGAITIDEYDTTNVHEVVPFSAFNDEEFLKAIHSRRTIRQFMDKEIEQEKIEKILDAGRYSPTGANAQDVAFTILGSKQDEVEKLCVSLFRFGVNSAKTFVKGIRNINIDDKFFFKGSKLVILVSAKSKLNGGLASAYMEMMAATLGIGTLYSGFFETCFSLSPKIRRLIKLPKDHKLCSCMVLGYPKVKYKRTVPRNKANVRTL